VALVGALIFGFGVSANGRAQPIALDYAQAEGCPNEAWLRAEVAARLGRDPFVDAARAGERPVVDVHEGRREPQVVARVTSERHARGWRGSLELLSTGDTHADDDVDDDTADDAEADAAHPRRRLRSIGRRELEDDDCRELTAALALSLAMTLDTFANDGEIAPGDATNAGTTSGAEGAPSAATANPSTAAVTTEGASIAPRELALRFEVAEDERASTTPSTNDRSAAVETPRSLHVVARGGVTLGLRSDLAPRVELGLALRHSRFVLELGGAFGPPTRGDVAGRSLRTRDGELQVAPCLRAFEVWDVCGVVGLGRLAVAASDDRSPRAWTASIGVRTEAAWPLGRSGAPVALTFALDVRANLRRPSVISGDETLWRAAPMRGAFLVGLRWRFAAWTESRGHAQAAQRRDDDAVGRRVGWARTGAPWTTRSGA
jgi:hypothetical protein